jgi:hypothetical protein
MTPRHSVNFADSIISEWVHDRYNDEDQEDPRQHRQQRGRFPIENFKKRPLERDMFVLPPTMQNTQLTSSHRDGYRLRVDNLHFEIEESDLRVCRCFLFISELILTLHLEPL